MSFIKHAIISAAGMGTRLGLNTPKCLLKFNGVSIIEHQLDLLRDVEDVRVVVGFMEEDLHRLESFRLEEKARGGLHLHQLMKTLSYRGMSGS